MQKGKLILVVLLCISTVSASVAQELNANVSILAAKVNPNVPRSTFTTLEKALNAFLNNRKWTNNSYAPHEKIECKFQLTLDSGEVINEYRGKLTVVAARPIFNTNILSTTMSYVDNDIYFKYIEFQPLEFNENRVAGNDALTANLPAIFAFYAYMILGIDNNTFQLKTGEPFFLKAQNIVNNAPSSGKKIKGWANIDGLRNRYWMVENFINVKYNIIHSVYYNYYRLVMDKLYEDEFMARSELINVINMMYAFSIQNSNTFVQPFFFYGKANDIIKILKPHPIEERRRISELLQKIDVTNASRYKEELK